MEAKTIEEIYQRKTPIEHILLRPDTYIGSIERESQQMYVWDDKTGKIVQRTISYVPGLYKIFDEIIVNAADNRTRDPKMNLIRVNIDQSQISVYNNGKGIPVRIHATEKVYVCELIFGNLLTSSNYNDNEKKVTGGRNGYGAKLCNIFSTEFIVETADSEVKKKYKQIYRDNMSVREDPIVEKYTGKDYTQVTFRPDFKRFGMECLDSDILSLLKKRVYDLAGILAGVNVELNGTPIPVRGFKEYVSLYLNSEAPIVHQVINPRWEIAFTPSEEQFQQVSFVNNICTSKGGSHVNHVMDQLIEPLIEMAKKKDKNLTIKPFQVKSNFFIFINSLIENPAFDSQTKENLTLRQSSFGSKCAPLDTFLKNIVKTGLLERITDFARAKQSAQLKKSDGTKTTRLTGLPKLDDANNAGTKLSHKCTLILTEGDSAKSLAMAGLGKIGRDNYGVFPLRGKLLNVREATHKQIMENAEISAIKKILGLQHGKVYTSVDTLRYGHVMIMTDQDHDGSHIKGLLINFLDHFFPSLLKIPNFLQEFITPIIRATHKRTKQTKDFFSIPEFESWWESVDKKEWSTKYYKGLGTSTPADAKQYFTNLDKHVKVFTPMTDEDKSMIDLAFNKKKADERKTWLSGYVPGTYLDNTGPQISIRDFVNKELILFSMADNIRSIPSVVDGLKPGQRKVIFSCFKKNLKEEIKVAQLAGYVAGVSVYHHGEQSLASTIVNLAQDYVGSNNINLLLPLGQFGTRLQGGKDAASSRYIYTALSRFARLIFHSLDDPLLNYLNEENVSIEPEYYVPIIPMALVNGPEGIGTGWSSNIPNFSPRDIVANLYRLLADNDIQEMKPFYRGFRGNIQKVDPGRYRVSGIYEVIDDTVEITELPIGVWTQNYKEFLEGLVSEGELKDFKEHHTERTVYFILKFAPAKLKEFMRSGLEKKLKLSTTITLNNMVCFDKMGRIRRYANVEEILKDFYHIRLEFYMRRKEHCLKVMKEELVRIRNKVRFIREVVEGTLIVSKRKKENVENDLTNKNYDKLEDSYDYLLNMAIMSMTYERIEKLNTELETKVAEYEDLQKRTPKDLWRKDLEEFMKEFDKVEEEAEKELDAETKGRKGGSKRKAAKVSANKKSKASVEEKPWEKYNVVITDEE
ncbi:DNA topoisomerase 2 [Astathelohania contejeani]|uniref:DNA topoisomerase 2 n=1 Tax=Astathelohania contejeani TaxID=164912 RepID=A0ABQ7HYN8_9MICR|nr:DNA topoisomerase 2 [Thelohania contejeani]